MDVHANFLALNELRNRTFDLLDEAADSES
jgi:hypothetical protein